MSSIVHLSSLNNNNNNDACDGFDNEQWQLLSEETDKNEEFLSLSDSESPLSESSEILIVEHHNKLVTWNITPSLYHCSEVKGINSFCTSNSPSIYASTYEEDDFLGLFSDENDDKDSNHSSVSEHHTCDHFAVPHNHHNHNHNHNHNHHYQQENYHNNEKSTCCNHHGCENQHENHCHCLSHSHSTPLMSEVSIAFSPHQLTRLSNHSFTDFASDGFFFLPPSVFPKGKSAITSSSTTTIINTSSTNTNTNTNPNIATKNISPSSSPSPPSPTTSTTSTLSSPSNSSNSPSTPPSITTTASSLSITTKSKSKSQVGKSPKKNNQKSCNMSPTSFSNSPSPPSSPISIISTISSKSNENSSRPQRNQSKPHAKRSVSEKGMSVQGPLKRYCHVCRSAKDINKIVICGSGKQSHVFCESCVHRRLKLSFSVLISSTGWVCPKCENRCPCSKCRK